MAKKKVVKKIIKRKVLKKKVPKGGTVKRQPKRLLKNLQGLIRKNQTKVKGLSPRIGIQKKQESYISMICILHGSSTMQVM